MSSQPPQDSNASDLQSDVQPASQRMGNTLGNINISGDSASFSFAPVQIGTKIETQIIQISVERITQRELKTGSPYKGLRQYNTSDREYFFGRDALIARLFEAVNRDKLLLVLGASGSGKSSAIRAGLIPELASNLEGHRLFSFVFTPGRNPFEKFYSCLIDDRQDYQFSEEQAERARVSSPQTLLETVQHLKQNGDRWLIFVDQFEEIFTNCNDESLRENFIDALVYLNDQADESVRLVLAMRADFIEYFSAYPQLGSVVNNNNIHLVTDMHPDELRQAIEQPAAKHGVVFEEGLVEQIIKEVQGQSGYLPLLQYTLNLLWETECELMGKDGKPHISDRTLNRSSYVALEGIRGALQARIKEIYRGLTSEEKEATRQIFIKLVRIVNTDAGWRAVSQRAYHSEFQGNTVETTLRKFIRQSMIVGGYDYSSDDQVLIGSGSKLERNATYEVAHEIILSSWDDLKKWVEESKDAILVKSLLRDAVRQWKSAIAQNATDDVASDSAVQEELLSGSRLSRIVELRDNNAFDMPGVGQLTDEENQFIDASIEWQTIQRQRQAELETEKERNRLLSSAQAKAQTIIKSGIVSLVVIVLITLGTSLIAVQAFRRLTVARAGTELEQAGVSALRQVRSGEIDALLAAIHAGKELQSYVNETTLYEQYPAVSPVLALQKITDSIYEKNRFEPGQGTIDDQGALKAAAFTPTGETLITGGEDGIIHRWSITGESMGQFQAHADGQFISINALDISPDGQYIASASDDKTVRLLTEAGNEDAVLMGHEGAVHQVDFNSAGTRLATAGDYGEVFIWDTTGQQLAALNGHQGTVHDVTFSPDGQSLATASADGTVRLWDISGTELAQWEAHQGETVYSVGFSPDGEALISAGQDRTAKIWSLSGQEQQVLDGHRLLVVDARFDPNGDRIATASDDGTIKLWSLDGEELAEFQGHRGTVWNAAFSPDGHHLLSTSRDGTARLWSLEKQSPQMPKFLGLKDDANSVSISPDGSVVAAGGDEGILSVWDALGNSLESWRTGERGHIFSIAFSPDGQQIATGGAARIVTIWSLSGERLAQVRGHGGLTTSLSFSPDGGRLATVGSDGNVRLWTSTGEEIVSFQGHDDVIGAVTFSPEGSFIATADWSGWIKLWDLSGNSIREWQGHQNPISDLDISEDGKHIITSDRGGTVRLWTRKGRQELEFFSYQSGVNALAFVPNSGLISTGGMDGTVRVWDFNGRQITEFTHQAGAVWGIAPSADGKRILAGGDAGEVNLWEIQTLSDAIDQGCMWLHDYLQNAVSVVDQNICFPETK